jgi:hypothetical protein
MGFVAFLVIVNSLREPNRENRSWTAQQPDPIATPDKRPLGSYPTPPPGEDKPAGVYRNGKRVPLQGFRPDLKVPVAEPKLMLLNWRWYEEHSYAIAEGEVRNVSALSLQNVEVVVRFYTSSGELITYDTALIEYNPILPDQTSPFKVMAKYNPQMSSASISFKYLMGAIIPADSVVATQK